MTVKTPARQGLTILGADKPTVGFMAWEIRETLGTGYSKLGQILLDLELGRSGLKLIVVADGESSGSVLLAMSDSTAKKLKMSPALQHPNPAPSWRVCSLSKGNTVAVEKPPVGSMPVSGIEPKLPGWLRKAVLGVAESAASPEFGTLVGSERQHVSIREIPGESWAKWGEFERRAEEILDVLGVMNS